MSKHCNPQGSPAQTLAALLVAHPEVVGLTWSIDPSGVIHGVQTAEDGHGRIVDDIAAILGGTPVHTTVNRDDDSVGLASLITVWHGVNFEVWASYAETTPRRPLGTVAVLPSPACPAKDAHNAATCPRCSMLRHPSQRAARAALSGLPWQGGAR
ncbi:hypothetical protein ACFV27_00565 [Streptomyces antimycoticus]|uniref:hypothetical protein n=1 Tax=Streptomyces antimycoticus TaxID=68175 RepID=UPI0036A88026